jgi:predicted phage terminase large subunit-like protein
VPDRTEWGKEGWTVKRTKLQRDHTFEPGGIMGRAGGRTDLLIADDICDLRNSVQQPAMREQVKDSWQTNWYPMRDLSRDAPPRVWKVGTCYHVADITADWRAEHEPDGSLLRLPVVGWSSPWPTVFSEEELQKIRMAIGPMAFARSYELKPVSADVLVFPAEWLLRSMYDEYDPDLLTRGSRIATIDWAFTEKKQKDNPDASVCMIGMKDDKGHVWLEDVLSYRGSFPEFKRRAIERCGLFNVQACHAEGNGPQKGLVQQMNSEAPFPVIGLDREKDKITRAAEQQAFVESGRFHIKATKDSGGVLRPIASQQVVYDEMTTFPAGDHDDTVDAAVDMMAATKPRRKRSKRERISNPHLSVSTRGSF